MGMDSDFKEWFPGKKKGNFKMSVTYKQGQHFYNILGLFARFDKKIRILVGKLTASKSTPGTCAGKLTSREVEKLFELVKKIVSNSKFKTRLKRELKAHQKEWGWLGCSVFYDYKEKGKEYCIAAEGYDHNEADAEGNWIHEYDFAKIDYGKFMLDFLELLVRNKSGLKSETSY